MLQSSRPEDHMKTIAIDQSSFTRSYFEHICMNNIKKIYQHAGKYGDQQNLKDVLGAALLSTPEGVIDNNPNVHIISTPVKKSSTSNSQTYWMLNLKQQNVVFWLQNPNANP